MNDPQPISPRARLQTLLAIPENKRTDAEWDEINELEISLAAGNRPGAPQNYGNRGNNPPGGGGHQNQNQNQNGGGGGRGQRDRNKQGRKFHHHNRPPRRP